MALLDLFNIAEQGVDTNINHYRFTITGGFGTGKSTLSAELFNRMGKAVTFGFEDRFKGIGGLNLVKINNWNEARQYVQQLKIGVSKGKKLPFDCVILDPVGRAGDMCSKYICKENNVEDLGDIPYGGGYSMLETEFDTFVDDLSALGLKVNYVAHGKLATIRPPRDPEGYQIYQPDVPKKLIYKTQGEADFICYLDVVRDVDEETGKSTPKRRLYLQNYADYQLKVPITGMPDYIEYETPSEGADKFIEAFNNAIKGNTNGSKPEEQKVVEKTDLEKLQDKAALVRDKNLKKNGGTMTQAEMKKVLEEHLGTYKIAECSNTDALSEFIKKYTE